MNKIKSILAFLGIIIAIGLQSCNQQGEKNEDIKASLIKNNDELFNKQNLNYADEIFSDDYKGKGPDTIKKYVSERITAFPDLEVKVDPIIVEGNMIGWLRTNTGTQVKSYMGYPATGKKIIWTDIVLSRHDDKGKTIEEWSHSDIKEKLQDAVGIDGVYEYLPPLKGQSINKNGYFVYLFGPSDGSQPMISNSGTYTLSKDTVKNIIKYSTDPSQIGNESWFRVKSWHGDTATFETMNTKGEITGEGRGVRLQK